MKTSKKRSIILKPFLILPFIYLTFIQLTNKNKNVEQNIQDFITSLSTSTSSLQQETSCYPPLGVAPVRRRNDLGILLQERNFTTGIEVGVQNGMFSKRTLENWNSCTSYKLVDLWAQQENYEDTANKDNAVHDKIFDTAKKRLKKWEDKTEFFRMYSSEAAKLFPHESTDYIYIDARHDYCGVMADLKDYWPILKKGGIMAGHDYVENFEVEGPDWGLCGDGSRNERAVKGAVDDFFIPKGLTISITYMDGALESWIVQKPLC